MEVVLDALATVGLPENAVVSVRCGAVRRQAPLDTVTVHPLRFPELLDNLSEPLKIDVLQPLASTRLVLRRQEETYRFGFRGKAGWQMGLRVQRSTAGKGAQAADDAAGAAATCAAGSSVAPVSSTRLVSATSCKFQDAAAAAREYLESHGLLRYVQSLLHAVIQVRPADPFLFMAEQLSASSREAGERQASRERAAEPAPAAAAPAAAGAPVAAAASSSAAAPAAAAGGGAAAAAAHAGQAEAVAARETAAEAARRVRRELGGDASVVCVLGGTEFRSADSEELVKAMAPKLEAAAGPRVRFVTGAMAGVQEAFARHCGDGSRVWNLLPVGQSSGYGRGTDVHAGADLEERRAIFGLVGDVYVTVEGGPGVAQEAGAAHARGAAVVPLMRTGGASCGMFGFPEGALRRPRFATDEQWLLLRSRDAPAEASAAAAAAIVQQACCAGAASAGEEVSGGRPGQMDEEDLRARLRATLEAAAAGGHLEAALSGARLPPAGEAGGPRQEEELRAEVRSTLEAAAAGGRLDDVLGRARPPAEEVDGLNWEEVRARLRARLKVAVASGSLEKFLRGRALSEVHGLSSEGIRARARATLELAVENGSLEEYMRARPLSEVNGLSLEGIQARVRAAIELAAASGTLEEALRGWPPEEGRPPDAGRGEAEAEGSRDAAGSAANQAAEDCAAAPASAHSASDLAPPAAATDPHPPEGQAEVALPDKDCAAAPASAHSASSDLAPPAAATDPHPPEGQAEMALPDKVLCLKARLRGLLETSARAGSLVGTLCGAQEQALAEELASLKVGLQEAQEDCRTMHLQMDHLEELMSGIRRQHEDLTGRLPPGAPADA